MEQWTGSKLGKEYIKTVLCHNTFLTYAQYNMKCRAGTKIAGRNINDLRYADDTILKAESEEELRSLLMRVKQESVKAGLKFSIKKQKSWHQVPSLHG